MVIDLQPVHLKNEFVQLSPLTASDVERLYQVASDPLICEQHPNKNRYQRADFLNYFEGAIKSGGAFIVFDTVTKQVIGSSRFCNYNNATSSIEIGYTFLSRDHWGSVYNKALKTIMLNYIFTFVDHVNFFIGAQNIRSQKSIVRIGAQKIGEQDVEYYGEPKKLNFIYQIDKIDWINRHL
jgi:RimJ/RimL family protein N-acetyltransferase